MSSSHLHTTPELMYYQQELVEHPKESHQAIAIRLGVATRVITLVCKELMGSKCKHGSIKSKNDTLKTRGAPDKTRWRTVGINITDRDWETFKSKYPSAAQRLGEMIREDIRPKGKPTS